MRTTLTLTNTTRIRAEDPLSIVFDDPLTGDHLTLMVAATSIVQRRLLENLAAAVWKLLQPGIDSLELDRRLGYDDKIAAGDIHVGSQVEWRTSAPGYHGTVTAIDSATAIAMATVDRPGGDGKFVIAARELRLLDSRDPRYDPPPDELAAGDHFAGMPDTLCWSVTGKFGAQDVHCRHRRDRHVDEDNVAHPCKDCVACRGFTEPARPHLVGDVTPELPRGTRTVSPWRPATKDQAIARLDRHRDV